MKILKLSIISIFILTISCNKEEKLETKMELSSKSRSLIRIEAVHTTGEIVYSEIVSVK